MSTKETNHMITVSVKGILIGILLIALIVLVVFLIVLIANVTDTIKKANAIIDGGTSAAKGAKNKVDDVNAMVKERASQAAGLASTGVKMAEQLLNKILNK